MFGKKKTKPQIAELPGEVVEMPKPKYDATKAYRWDSDYGFMLSGTEFGFIYNSLGKEKADLIKKLQMLDILEQKLRLAVEEGDAKEVEPEVEQMPG